MDVALLRSPTGRDQAIAHFKSAVAADPRFAGAHAGLAQMLHAKSSSAAEPERSKLLEEAWRAARLAVALDDADPDARLALGTLHLYDTQNMALAEQEIRRAIALDARVHRGHEHLARLYMRTGRPVEQLAAARLGLESEPLSHSSIREYSLALAMNGRCKESLGQLEALKNLDPPAQVAGVIKGLCFLAGQQWTLAIEEFRWAGGHGARSAPAFLAFALARNGQREEAQAMLQEFLSGELDSHGAFGKAIAYAGLDDLDNAFKWLDQTIEEDTARIYLVHPALADLQRDPRFALYLHRASFGPQ
jgi:tetratricopeptide (TPR) repeat protein